MGIGGEGDSRIQMYVVLLFPKEKSILLFCTFNMAAREKSLLLFLLIQDISLRFKYYIVRCLKSNSSGRKKQTRKVMCNFHSIYFSRLLLQPCYS